MTRIKKISGLYKELYCNAPIFYLTTINRIQCITVSLITETTTLESEKKAISMAKELII